MNIIKYTIIQKFCMVALLGTVLSAPLHAQEIFIEQINSKPALLQQVALKTNLLVDGAMVPNIGLQLAFLNQWSADFNYYGAWWHNDSRHRYWQTYAGSVEVKKWLGKRAKTYFLEGHHLGLYFMAGSYDFEWGNKGMRSDFTFNVGLSYGYGVKIARSLYLDFAIGVGYLNGKQDKYRPQNDDYCVYNKKHLRFFGPTKAEVSLVWSIGDLLLKSRKEASYEIVY